MRTMLRYFPDFQKGIRSLSRYRLQPLQAAASHQALCQDLEVSEEASEEVMEEAADQGAAVQEQAKAAQVVPEAVEVLAAETAEIALAAIIVMIVTAVEITNKEEVYYD